MDAVIIAAGEGTRMRPLTRGCPKPLLPLGESTLIEQTMDRCLDVVDRFVLVVGYMGNTIEERLGDEYSGIPIEYVTQEDALGTAHAIGCARDAVDGRFLVINGDVVIDDRLPRKLAESDGDTIAVQPVENPSSYGVVEIENGAVRTLVEKPDDPPSNLVNTGIYAFEPEIFEYIDRTEKSPRGEYEITEAIELLMDDGHSVGAVEYDGPWLDVGRPWELLDANEVVMADLDGRIDGAVEDGATLHGPVVVEEGARIRAGAYIKGPVVVRSGADVGPNAYVRGATVLGEGVRVGNAVEVKNSVVMAGTAAGHLSYVGDSVLGQDVNFGAGTKVANLRHDDENVSMRVKGEQVDTGRRKLGVVVGDRTKTGINTSLNVGVKLGVEASTMPGESVLDDRT